tara:strand:+ start:703 stop:1527 length:825 start_codon:yes stop_codon:yes gene_type:complete
MTKKILVVGCSFTRGIYGSEVEELKRNKHKDLNPHNLVPTDILYDLLEEGGLDDFELYNVSIYCSSIATQAMIIQTYLKKHTPDFIVWQVTTPHRLGLINDPTKFFNAINPKNLQRQPASDNKPRNNHYLLPFGINVKFGFDPVLGGIWLNPGTIYNKKDQVSNNAKWTFDVYNKMNAYAVGEVGGYHFIESIQAQLYYTHALIEKENIPHLVYPWLKSWDKHSASDIDIIDFVVQDTGLLDKHWTDIGIHMGPKGNTELMTNYVAPEILKALK